ncbi:MAG: nucleotidyltransferase family protein [Planctomycetes bacterium]|nr:nucleotidyltransferase family protein [Planctomycetota bacterium]
MVIEIKYTGDALWERIERAVESVRDRLRRVTRSLNSAGIPYAVIGGNAVQHWVSQVDESVVRNTRDVDIILNEADLERAIAALEAEGFIYRRSAGVTMFLDGPDAKARDAVHVVFAGKKVREDYPEPVPDLGETEWIGDARTLPFEKLVRMKLTSFRRRDQVHLLDMISVGLIDANWLGRLPPPLQTRLEELLNDPNDGG